MNIYFCGSIRGGRDFSDTYKKIIAILGRFGKVLTEHLGSDDEIEKKDRILTDKEIHDRDLSWIMDSDLLVAEVTIPSLGVGYEIGRAIEWGKPVLCLFQPDKGRTLSAMIAGSDRVVVNEYRDVIELKALLGSFISNQLD